MYLRVCLDQSYAAQHLSYFTYYDLFRYLSQVKEIISYSPKQDEAPHKRHPASLHYSFFAYVGDLHDKAIWLMTYHKRGSSEGTQGIRQAANLLLSPYGYRGQKAERKRILEAAIRLRVLHLAKACPGIGPQPEATKGL